MFYSSAVHWAIAKGHILVNFLGLLLFLLLIICLKIFIFFRILRNFELKEKE